MGAGEGGWEAHSGFTGIPDLRAVLRELRAGAAADLFAATSGAGAFAFLRTWQSFSSCSTFVGAGRPPFTLTSPGLAAAGTWPVMSKEAQDPDRLGVACLGAQGYKEILNFGNGKCLLTETSAHWI